MVSSRLLCVNTMHAIPCKKPLFIHRKRTQWIVWQQMTPALLVLSGNAMSACSRRSSEAARGQQRQATRLLLPWLPKAKQSGQPSKAASLLSSPSTSGKAAFATAALCAACNPGQMLPTFHHPPHLCASLSSEVVDQSRLPKASHMKAGACGPRCTPY